MGLLTTGTIGLGKLIVKGLRRVPKPPAIINAFIASASSQPKLTIIVIKKDYND
jgi:hypothetical protein